MELTVKEILLARAERALAAFAAAAAVSAIRIEAELQQFKRGGR